MVDGTAVAKADFDFCRVDVDIHPGWIQCQIQDIDRKTVAVQYVFIGSANGMGQ